MVGGGAVSSHSVSFVFHPFLHLFVDQELQPILWWLIAALAAVIVATSLLTYWCWNKTRLKGAAISNKENELEQLIEEDELGMAPDLSAGNIGYNPLALGARQSGAVPAGNGLLDDKEVIPQNERANVMVEKFEERQQYGPNRTSNIGGVDNDGYEPPAYPL